MGIKEQAEQEAMLQPPPRPQSKKQSGGIRSFIKQKAREFTGYGLTKKEAKELRTRRMQKLRTDLAFAQQRRALQSEKYAIEKERLGVERERIGVQRLRQAAQPRGQPPGFFGQGYSPAPSGGIRPFSPLTGEFYPERRPALVPVRRKKAKSRRRRR